MCCEGEFPYFSTEIVGAAMIQGNDTQYMLDDSLVTVITGIDGSGYVDVVNDTDFFTETDDHVVSYSYVEQLVAVGDSTCPSMSCGNPDPTLPGVNGEYCQVLCFESSCVASMGCSESMCTDECTGTNVNKQEFLAPHLR